MHTTHVSFSIPSITCAPLRASKNTMKPQSPSSACCKKELVCRQSCRDGAKPADGGLGLGQPPNHEGPAGLSLFHRFTHTPAAARQTLESARSAQPLTTTFAVLHLQMALSEASLNADARKMNRASDSAASLANLSLKGNVGAHGELGRVQASGRNPNMLPPPLEAPGLARRSRLMASYACGAAP